MITLYIDTSSNEEIVLTLTIDGKKHEVRKAVEKRQSYLILTTIDELLKKHGVGLFNLTNIEVNTGPGSFTGLRVGIAIANALAWSLHIPVNDKKVGILEEPSYE